MQDNFDNDWMSPNEAYIVCRTVFRVTACKTAVLQRMPSEALQWGQQTRGEAKGNPLAQTVRKVLFGHYLATARLVADEEAAAAQARKGAPNVNERLEALERRIEAMEAAFDSLLGSTKEVA